MGLLREGLDRVGYTSLALLLFFNFERGGGLFPYPLFQQQQQSQNHVRKAFQQAKQNKLFISPRTETAVRMPVLSIQISPKSSLLGCIRTRKASVMFSEQFILHFSSSSTFLHD
jgi:hypothetical protein